MLTTEAMRDRNSSNSKGIAEEQSHCFGAANPGTDMRGGNSYKHLQLGLGLVTSDPRLATYSRHLTYFRRFEIGFKCL
jgi:hypothetical protein